jgi:hypothetical protein
MAAYAQPAFAKTEWRRTNRWKQTSGALGQATLLGDERKRGARIRGTVMVTDCNRRLQLKNDGVFDGLFVICDNWLDGIYFHRPRPDREVASNRYQVPSHKRRWPRSFKYQLPSPKGPDPRMQAKNTKRSEHGFIPVSLVASCHEPERYGRFRAVN